MSWAWQHLISNCCKLSRTHDERVLVPSMLVDVCVAVCCSYCSVLQWNEISGTLDVGWSYESLMSHINKSYEWVMPHMNKSCLVWTRHVSYKRLSLPHAHKTLVDVTSFHQFERNKVSCVCVKERQAGCIIVFCGVFFPFLQCSQLSERERESGMKEEGGGKRVVEVEGGSARLDKRTSQHLQIQNTILVLNDRQISAHIECHYLWR